MYPSIRTPPTITPPPGTVPERRGWLRVGPNVFFLGLTSLVTDVSSEMVAAILPLYLIFQLGLTPLQFGVFNGAYQSALGLIALATAFIADRRHRYKEIAAFGYGLSDACKLGMLAVGTAPFPASLVLLTDRAGKGIRTSPRDALISLSVKPARLAEAFGVHRAMDTAGALIGPLVAFLILDGAPRAYDAVFVVSFLIGLVGLGILVLFVRNRRIERAAVALPNRPSWRSVRVLLAMPKVRAVAIAGGLLGLVTFGDAFVYFTLQRRADFVASYFPLLYVGTAFGYLVLAVPLGRLADRWGRSKMFLSGYVALGLAYTLLLVPSPGVAVFIGILGLMGAFYAATDGVLAALVSSVVPVELRTTGIALVTTVLALAHFAASVIFGAAWSLRGPDVTIVWFLGATVLGIAASAWLLGRHPVTT
jgi:MFS family permease